MPLTELPHNHISRNRSRSARSEDASQRSDKRPVKASAPDPLQSMLKTTTEIGDVGGLALRPSRIPHPVRSDYSRRPDGFNGLANHHDHGFRRRRSRYQVHPERRPGALLASKGKVLSRSASIHGGDCSTPSPTTSQNLSNYDHKYENRSYSLTQSSRTSYSLSNYPSNASLNDFGEPHLVRPRSPFAYPTRLKRPGFRPSSPAFSQYNGSDLRVTNGLDRGPSFRTSSPSSLYAGRRLPGGFTSDYNQSTPSRTFRVQHERTKHYGKRTPPPPTRTANDVHRLGHNFPAPSVPEQNPMTVGGQGSGAPAMQQPRYYDYSEAFEEQGASRGVSLCEPSVPLVDQTIPEDRLPSVRQRLWETTAQETEFATTHTGDGHRPSEEFNPLSGGLHGIQAENAHSKKRAKEPETGSGVDLPTMVPDDMNPSSDYHTRIVNDQWVDIRNSRNDCFGTAVQQSPEIPIVSRSRDVSLISTSSNPENLGISSSLISLYQSPVVSESPTGPDKANQMGITEPLSLPVPSSDHVQPEGWKIPSLDFSLLDLAGQPGEPRHPPREQSMDLSRAGEARTPTIHAPVPRRSLSSQSKFSKILSVDEGSTELADTIKATEEVAEMFSSVNPNIQTGSKASLSTLKRPTSRLSIRSLSRMMKLATVGERDVPDPNEFSASTSSLVSTTPPAGKLVKRSRHGIKINATPDVGDSVPVEVVSVDHNMSDKSPDWNNPATTPITQGQELLTANAESLYPGQADTPGHLADNESANEDLMQLPADTSFRSISPPTAVMPTNLPYSFVPLAPDLAQASNVVKPDLEPAAPGILHPTPLVEDGKSDSTTRYRVRIRANRESDTSLSGSQPWNFEESYPWTDRHPSIDVRMPAPLTHSQQRPEKPPKFKLKISRASKVNKTAVFQKADTHKRTGSPSVSFSGCHPTRKHRFGHLISSTRTSTSSDSLPAPLLAISTPSFRPAASGTPNPSLLSPPGHSAEVQSFFSDDSSQMQQKGSIRKRLSELKAKLPASRGTSTDEARAMDRHMARSVMNRSRASRRTSNPGEDGTAGISNARYTKLKVVEKIKGWWQEGASKVRGLGGKRKEKDAQAHGAATGAYVGL